MSFLASSIKNLLPIVVLLVTTCFGSLQAQTVSDESEIQAFTRNFMCAYNRQDHAALGEMYLSDAVQIDAEGKQIKGADSIAMNFEEQFRFNNVTLLLRSSAINWSDAQYAFVASGTYEIYGNTYVYDIKINTIGSYANTMVKENGTWKIARSVLMPPRETGTPASKR